MSTFAPSFNDPASGDWRDNQADGYKEPGTEAPQPVFAAWRPKGFRR